MRNKDLQVTDPWNSVYVEVEIMQTFHCNQTQPLPFSAVRLLGGEVKLCTVSGKEQAEVCIFSVVATNLR